MQQCEGAGTVQRDGSVKGRRGTVQHGGVRGWVQYSVTVA